MSNPTTFIDLDLGRSRAPTTGTGHAMTAADVLLETLDTLRPVQPRQPEQLSMVALLIETPGRMDMNKR